MMEISKVVQRVATVERKAAKKAEVIAGAEKEKRELAEKALAALEQEMLQLKALLKVGILAMFSPKCMPVSALHDTKKQKSMLR